MRLWRRFIQPRHRVISIGRKFASLARATSNLLGVGMLTDVFVVSQLTVLTLEYDVIGVVKIISSKSQASECGGGNLTTAIHKCFRVIIVG